VRHVDHAVIGGDQQPVRGAELGSESADRGIQFFECSQPVR